MATAEDHPSRISPHPDACLTCPDFQTTPEFLTVHRKQAASNRRLIARADADGHFRLAENLRKVQASLECIIPALEAIENETPTDAGLRSPTTWHEPPPLVTISPSLAFTTCSGSSTGPVKP